MSELSRFMAVVAWCAQFCFCGKPKSSHQRSIACFLASPRNTIIEDSIMRETVASDLIRRFVK